ncbi:MAG TPA: sugar ABC transporter permease [Acetobacteraceae bacterium]
MGAAWSTVRVTRGMHAAPVRWNWQPWLLLAPSLLFLFAFTYWPLIQVLQRSFVDQAFGGAASWGVGNYTRLFADSHFSRASWNNLVYAAATIVPSVILALAFALRLRETTLFTMTLRTLVVLPLLIPLVAAAALFTFVFLPGEGLLDWYLAPLGLRAVNWLGSPTLALGAVAAITVWKNTGYYMLFFLAGLAGVPAELLDAARIDGAGALSRFRHVTLPMLGPTFGFVLPMALANALVQVDQVVTVTQGGPSDSTNLLLYYIYQQAEQNHDAGLAAAATVISVAALLSLTVASLRSMERGIHYES